MALRDFTDVAGRRWTVWSVHPSADAPLPAATTPTASATADSPDMLRDGWLVFETHGERRRLVPIPAGWETADPLKLEAHLAEAIQVPPRDPMAE